MHNSLITSWSKSKTESNDSVENRITFYSPSQVINGTQFKPMFVHISNNLSDSSCCDAILQTPFYGHSMGTLLAGSIFASLRIYCESFLCVLYGGHDIRTNKPRVSRSTLKLISSYSYDYAKEANGNKKTKIIILVKHGLPQISAP